MVTHDLIKKIKNGMYDETLKDIYVDEKKIAYERERYIKAIESYTEHFGEGEVFVFSAPGRSEIGGNHTDHQCGEVVFRLVVTSDVLIGAGLSSSAVFETLMGTILSYLFNDGKISPIEIAMIGQFAENVYFGKPCGLMDQMACSVGSLAHIDFQNPAAPLVERIEFDLDGYGYSLCITDTKGSHADWAEKWLPNYEITEENLHAIVQKEIGFVFAKVLECAGVYKRTPEGQAAFKKFLECI